MEKLIFSHNWNNKLDCINFTTLRLHNPNRYSRGAKFDIIYKKGKEEINKGSAVIIDIYPCRFNNLSEHACRLDTGYSKEDTLKMVCNMYKNVPGFSIQESVFDLILLQKTAKHNRALTKFENYHQSCPRCQTPWSHQQIQSQTCPVCNYPENNDNY